MCESNGKGKSVFFELNSMHILNEFEDWWKNVGINLQDRAVITRDIDKNDIDSLIYHVAYQSWLDGYFKACDNKETNPKNE